MRPDEHISPTGFPFQTAEVDGTVAQASVHEARPRICDLGFLTQAYKRDDGTVGYRCPAEPVERFNAKIRSPLLARNVGARACLCNDLFAAAGLPQRRDDYEEPPLVTLGATVQQDFMGLARAYGMPITAQKVFMYAAR